jgi:hypothetical protein
MIDSSAFQGKKAAYYTLGCKLNFSETSTFGKMLEDMGVITAQKGEKADICLINTCSVTEVADHKCRQAIHRMVRQNPGAFVIVTGCYAQLESENVSKIEGVDLVLGANEKAHLIQYLSDAWAKKFAVENGLPVTGENLESSDSALQGLIVGTLNAILHQYEGVPVQRLEIIQQFIAHAIRTGSYHDSYHILYLQRLLVHLTEKFHLGVGIGISLEISQILHIRILPAEEGLALLQLLRNRLPAVAIAGIERTVVAVRASSARDSSIPVRTGESCIYRNLLNPEVRKPLPDPGAKIIVVH